MGIYCIENISNGLQTGSCNVIPDTFFIREVTLTTSAVDTVEASIVTRWGSGTEQHESSLTTIFTNWN